MRTRPRRARSLALPPLPADPGGTPALIIGYRVLRRLASSDRADVYVGVAPERRARMPVADGDAPERNDHGPVVLKVFRPAAEQAGVEREVRALTLLGAGRLATLLDLGTLPDGRAALVLEQVTGGSLGRYLEEQRRVRPGEAVTILAPIAAALAELHAHGLVHTGLNLSTVLFDSVGRPVMTGLGALRELPGGGHQRTEALCSVQGQVAQMVRAVLAQVRTGDADGTALRALDRWCTPPGPGAPAGTVEELEHLLFAWAEAAPVRLARDRAPAEETRPEASGQLLRRALPDPPSGGDPTAAGPGRVGESRFGRIRGTLSARGQAAAVRLRQRKALESLRAPIDAARFARRGPLILAAVVTVVATGLLLTAFGDPGDTIEPETHTETQTEAASPADSDASDPADEAVTGDDPVVAVPVLLGLRSRCLHEVSVICLDGVHQAQSAALAADTYALRMLQQGGRDPDPESIETWTTTLVERTGDAALVTLQAPDPERQSASVLVVKGEAGWRIREIFDY